MPINLTTFESTLETKLNAASSSNESKELLLLSKAAEAVNNSITTGGTINGNLTITGDLQVDGTQTVINSSTLTVDDLNITTADRRAHV